MTKPVVPVTLEPHARGRLLRGVVIFAAAGAAIYLAAVLWAGADRTAAAFTRLGSGALLLGTAVASLAYLVRFARWHGILAALGHRLRVGLNLRVYIAGLALTSSPVKLGETLRSILLLPHGVSVPQSLAAFFADRLSDVVGVALLGAAAGWLGGGREPVLELAFISTLVGSVLVVQLLRSDLGRRLGRRLEGRGKVGRVVAALAAPAAPWARLWTAPRILFFTVAAVVAYGVQGLVFAAYAKAIGAQAGVAECIAMFASATLLGAASMIPAGLGAMEAALVVQLGDKGVPLADAVAVAIATRLSTLWCSIFLGVLALSSFARPASRHPAPPAMD